MESTKKNRKINLLRLNVMNDIEINSTLEEENHIRHGSDPDPLHFHIRHGSDPDPLHFPLKWRVSSSW